MITVMGATGRVGGQIARRLLAAGERVTALGRSAPGLSGLAASGASTLAGDSANPAFLTEAFQDARTVFTMLPSNPFSPRYHADQRKMSSALIQAIGDSGVRRVLFLSSLGAELPEGTGFITSLHRHEQRLKELREIDILVLRPGMFFETFDLAVDLIEQQGINADSVSPDVLLPMIATHDIAEFAADAILGGNFTGHQVRELLGERDLSFAQATEILGRAMGRPNVPYIQLPYEEMARTLEGLGFSQDFAQLHAEMAKAFNSRSVASLEGRHPRNTTPTSFEDFAAERSRARARTATG